MEKREVALQEAHEEEETERWLEALRKQKRKLKRYRGFPESHSYDWMIGLD